MFTSLDQVIDKLGGVAAVARLLRVSRQCVYNWPARGGRVPERHLPKLARALGVPLTQLLPLMLTKQPPPRSRP